MSETAKVSVRMTPELKKRLDDLARRERRSTSQVAVLLIERQLEQEPQSPATAG